MNSTLIKVRSCFIILVLLFAQSVHSQDYPCTVIDVVGSRYGDSMWLFTVDGTTELYDNGWDGLKIFGSALAPQIYVAGLDFNYQVYTSSNINNTVLGFIPGEDSVYSMIFRHYNIEQKYPELYLIDKLENNVVNISQEGYNYIFKSFPGEPLNRFEIVTSLSNVPDSVEVKPKNPNKGRGFNSGKSKSKPVVFFNGDNLIVDNILGEAHVLNLFDSGTGLKAGAYNISSKVVRLIKTQLKAGTYIILIEDDSGVSSQLIYKY